MARRTNAAITTACIGMAVGAAAYMASSGKAGKTRTKKLKKSTGKALRHVGEFIDNVSYMVK
ncbi:MAG: hypothetical protein FWG94_06980 [Oscillospiraceae bacterium]|nr:hypothetical protein [Oscillospiraceae bacterium]